MAAAHAGAGWRAELELGFERRDAVTRLVRRRHDGPLVVQSPFYPGDGACHVYVLHPPGGLVGGDRLHLAAEAGPGTRVLLTTPAATKIYRTLGPPSVQRQTLTAGEDAVLEWLPQEAIVFDGASAELATEVDLAASARFIGWEQWCLGRPAAGERYEHGRIVQRLAVRVDGAPVLDEVQRIEGGARFLEAPWGLAGHPAYGSFVAHPADGSALETARTLCGGFASGRAGATLVDRLLVCRALAAGAEGLGRLWRALWAALRQPLAGLDPRPPRIWAT